MAFDCYGDDANLAPNCKPRACKMQMKIRLNYQKTLVSDMVNKVGSTSKSTGGISMANHSILWP